MSTLKRTLRKYGLRRSGQHTSLRDVGNYTLVRSLVIYFDYFTYIQTELRGDGSLLGYCAMHQRPRRRYGVRIPRYYIASSEVHY